MTVTGFDWTGVTGRLWLKLWPDAPTALCEIEPSGGTPDTTSAMEVISLGLAEFTFTVESSVSSAWPVGTLYGDIEVSRVSAARGPYTPVQFKFDLVADQTV